MTYWEVSLVVWRCRRSSANIGTVHTPGELIVISQVLVLHNVVDTFEDDLLNGARVDLWAFGLLLGLPCPGASPNVHVAHVYVEGVVSWEILKAVQESLAAGKDYNPGTFSWMTRREVLDVDRPYFSLGK